MSRSTRALSSRPASSVVICRRSCSGRAWHRRRTAAGNTRCPRVRRCPRGEKPDREIDIGRAEALRVGGIERAHADLEIGGETRPDAGGEGGPDLGVVFADPVGGSGPAQAEDIAAVIPRHRHIPGTGQPPGCRRVIRLNAAPPSAAGMARSAGAVSRQSVKTIPNATSGNNWKTMAPVMLPRARVSLPRRTHSTLLASASGAACSATGAGPLPPRSTAVAGPGRTAHRYGGGDGW